MAWLLLPTAGLGWLLGMAAIINRLQPIPAPARLITAFEVAWLAMMAIVPPVAVGVAVAQSDAAGTPPTWMAAAFVVLTGVALATAVSRALAARRDRWLRDRAIARTTVETRPQRVSRAREGLATTLLRCVPGNEIDRVDVVGLELRHDHLPASLDGLRIAHLSDLHFRDRLGPERLTTVVDRINEFRPDLVVLTGDLVEQDDAIEDAAARLGRLAARRGVAFILGNHDGRLGDPGRLRRALTAEGLWDVGGRWRDVPGYDPPLRLVGHEGPWFAAPPSAPAATAAVPPADPTGRVGPANGHAVPSARSAGRPEPAAGAGPRPFTIGLFHTPDMLPWGVAHGVDLILAGHTHGGQVRLPGLGAVFVPSVYGTRYSQGLYRRDETLMFVNRGFGHLIPIRLGAPPEVVLITLRKPTVDSWDEVPAAARASAGWVAAPVPAVSRVETVRRQPG